MLCKECKKEIRDDSKFCKHCGRNVENDLKNSFCSSCGQELKSDSLFCKNCGASIGSTVSVTEKSSKYDRAFMVKVAAILVLFVVAVSTFLPRNEEGIKGGKDDPNGPVEPVEPVEPVGPVRPVGPVDPSQSDCFICGGDGKKDCTSCDNGYIINYESGSFCGYGPTSYEVKTKCELCKGLGEVTCFH